MKKYIEVDAEVRLPEDAGFYFCNVTTKDKRNVMMSCLRFGSFDDIEDKNFYTTCDIVVPNDRILWLEEIS